MQHPYFKQRALRPGVPISAFRCLSSSGQSLKIGQNSLGFGFRVDKLRGESLNIGNMWNLSGHFLGQTRMRARPYLLSGIRPTHPETGPVQELMSSLSRPGRQHGLPVKIYLDFSSPPFVIATCGIPSPSSEYCLGYRGIGLKHEIPGVLTARSLRAHTPTLKCDEAGSSNPPCHPVAVLHLQIPEPQAKSPK